MFLYSLHHQGAFMMGVLVERQSEGEVDCVDDYTGVTHCFVQVFSK